MGTQQALTNNQVEVLLVLMAIEKYVAEEDINAEFDNVFEAIAWDSVGIEDNEIEGICKDLERFGYIDNSKKLTLDGRQRTKLEIDRLSEELKEENTKENKIKKKNGFSLFDSMFTVKITGISVGDLGKVEISSEIGKSLFEWVKNQIQSIKR